MDSIVYSVSNGCSDSLIIAIHVHSGFVCVCVYRLEGKLATTYVGYFGLDKKKISVLFGFYDVRSEG